MIFNVEKDVNNRQSFKLDANYAQSQILFGFKKLSNYCYTDMNFLRFERIKIYNILLLLGFCAVCTAQKPKVFHHFDEKNGLSSNNVTAICRDRQGYLWVGTDYGLNRYDGYTFTPYLPNNQLLHKTISNEKINSLAEDSAGFLWIATAEGLFRYNPHTLTFQRWLNAGLKDNSLPNSLVLNILAEANDKLWLCCDNRDLCYMDTKNFTFTSFAWKAFVEQTVPEFAAKSYKSIQALKRKSENELWLYTNVGLFSFNTGNQHFTYHKKGINADLDLENYSKLPEINAPIQIKFEEKDGSFWLGGITGLWHYAPQNQYFDFIDIATAQKQAFRRYELSESDLYITAFYKKNALKINSRQDWTIPKQFLKSIKNKVYFIDICEDSEGNLWLATNEQWLFVWHKNTNTWSQPDIKDNYKPAATTALLADKKGKIVWIGTEDYGLFRYDEITKQFKLFRHEEDDPLHSLAGYSVYDIEKDGNGSIWVATSPGGLSRFEAKTQTFTNLSTQEGLPSNLVTSLISDKSGNIWGSTNRGLFFIEKDSLQVRTFNQKNGLLGDFTEGGVLKYINEKIIVNTTNEVQFFYPDSLLKDNLSPKIIVNSFKIFDKNIYDTLNINDLEKINLTWKENFFSCDFSSVNFNLSNKNEYAYRLVGFDKKWHFSSKQHSAAYTNVPPGDYLLEIKSGREGLFLPVGYRLAIHIEAPFWQKLWFKTLVFSFLLGLLYALYRYRIAQIRKEEQLKSEFNDRLAKVEMTALRAQMNPHFVFNCLNSINRFILVNQPDEASAYLTKFSRLIRLILDNSRSENVALDKELDALRLYIEMEALRFNNRFTYTITVDADVALEHIEVPPMLLQPYVENAIWHGLMHLETTGKLTIHVFNKGNNLGVVIEDNGIGRAKAAELKSKSATEQKSHGLKITAARIDIINQLYNTHNEVFITDLLNEQGKACGTRVELLLH